MSITVLIAPAESQCERLQSAIREGGSAMSFNGTQPHVSLAVFDALVSKDWEVLLSAVEIRRSAFELTFDSVGVFGGDASVIYLHPEPNSKLKALHRALHEAIEPIVSKCRNHYRPDTWHPHLTIAFPVANSEVAVVRQRISERKLLRSYVFDRMQIVSSPPWKVEKCVPFYTPIEARI